MFKSKLFLSMLLGLGMLTTLSSQVQAATYPFGIYPAKNKTCKVGKGDKGDDVLFFNLCLPASEIANNEAYNYLNKYLEETDPEKGDYNDVLYFKFNFNKYNRAKKQIVVDNNIVININDTKNIFNENASKEIIFIINNDSTFSLCHNSIVYNASVNNNSLIQIYKIEPSVNKISNILSLPYCSYQKNTTTNTKS